MTLIESGAHPAAPLSTEDLAAEFLVSIEHDHRPWPVAFVAWADARGLGSDDQYLVRAAVVRARVQAATEKGAANARAIPPRRRRW